MRILRVVSVGSASGRYGGPFDTAVRQANLLAGAGERVTVLFGHFRGDAPAPAFERSVRAATRPVRSWIPRTRWSAVFSLRLLLALWEEVGRSDVVHVSFARELTPFAAGLITLMRRRRLVLQTHGMIAPRDGVFFRVVDAMLRPVARRARAIIVLTSREERTLLDWLGGSPRTIHVIGNPVAVVRGDCGMGAGNALFVARLHPRKRVLDFGRAAQEAERSGHRTAYDVFGPDEGDLPALQVLAAQVPTLTYRGTLQADEVTREVARCGVFVLCSQDEPWGNVLATAIAMGRPVVVARSAALAGLIEQYGAGLVVTDGSPVAISAAVDKILSDSGLHRRLSDGGSQLARDHLQEDRVRASLLAALSEAAAREVE